VSLLLMKCCARALLALLFGVGTLMPGFAQAADSKHSAEEVLVVYNGDSQISKVIARDYAKKRKVRNVLQIQCIDSAVSHENETISLAEFEKQIAIPIRNYLKRHRKVSFIVLTKGVPIRIEGGDTGSKDLGSSGNLHPSVDSYLAAIDYSEIPGAVKIRITGSGATGYVWLNRYWKSTVPFSHALFGGYVVTRLDGYTQADAMSLVDRALRADASPSLKGKVLLDVQPDFKVGNKEVQPFPVTGDIASESDWGSWNADLVRAGQLLQNLHIPVELNLNQTFVGDESDLLGYFSWGSNDSHYNKQAYGSLFFTPGSIGDTAVSTSGRTFLPTSGGQSLIADLIVHGITGVKGYVNEPLLQAVASPSILLDRYFSGFNLGESFYAASRFVGWEDVVIGDPLCCSSSRRTGKH
jgi:uncharacterized protein (TIGR03790 family)